MVPYREVCKEVWKMAEKLKITLFFTVSVSHFSMCFVSFYLPDN